MGFHCVFMHNLEESAEAVAESFPGECDQQAEWEEGLSQRGEPTEHCLQHMAGKVYAHVTMVTMCY